jgi:hypothetical protein
MPKITVQQREFLVRRGRRLEYFTIFWNSLEVRTAVVSGIIAGIDRHMQTVRHLIAGRNAAGSVALVTFGLDSVIELTRAVALLRRLHQDRNDFRREPVERVTLRVVGACFLLTPFTSRSNPATPW